MTEQKLWNNFLISSLMITIFCSIVFYLFFKDKTVIFLISSLFNIGLSLIYWKNLNLYLINKNVKRIVMLGILKKVLIALFFFTFVYFSVDRLVSVFLIFIGLIVAPTTIRVVSYMKL